MPSSLLDLLSDAETSTLFRHRREIVLAGGDHLFHYGDPATTLYRVEQGTVSLYRLMPCGEEKRFKAFSDQGVIAEVALFMSPNRYPMSARADQDSVLSAFPRSTILSLLHASPELATSVLGFMANRINELMDNIHILTQVNARQRVVMKLAQLHRLQNQPGYVRLPVAKALLASQLGMKPETLSRTLSQLKRDGLLKEQQDRLLLLNVAALCTTAELSRDAFGSGTVPIHSRS